MSNNNDPAAILTSIFFIMILVYLVFIGAIIIIATAAVLVIGWYLTHLLLIWLNQLSDGQLQEGHGGMLLILAAGLWAFAAWYLVPQTWVTTLILTWPWLAAYPYFVPAIGGILGLVWSMLVLFVGEQEHEVSPLDVAGMYSLSEHDLVIQDPENSPETIEILADSVILGTDV